MEENKDNFYKDLESMVKKHQVWVALYHNKLMMMPSGKSSWGKSNHAKNAVRYALNHNSKGGVFSSLEEIKKLEESGEIRYKQVMQL